MRASDRGDAGPSAPGSPDQIHLSWSRDPGTSLTVTWHAASSESPGVVEYRERGR